MRSKYNYDTRLIRAEGVGMEFKEKLQLLRTGMKLSQEELANQLNLSRQSITKWENGQAFPDITNLIRLSEIFKVSIDKLVKENDICMVNLFGSESYPDQDMRAFLSGRKRIPMLQEKTKYCRPDQTHMIFNMEKMIICIGTAIWEIKNLSGRNAFG